MLSLTLYLCSLLWYTHKGVWIYIAERGAILLLPLASLIQLMCALRFLSISISLILIVSLRDRKPKFTYFAILNEYVGAERARCQFLMSQRVGRGVAERASGGRVIILASLRRCKFAPHAARADPRGFYYHADVRTRRRRYLPMMSNLSGDWLSLHIHQRQGRTRRAKLGPNFLRKDMRSSRRRTTQILGE